MIDFIYAFRVLVSFSNLSELSTCCLFGDFSTFRVLLDFELYGTFALSWHGLLLEKQDFKSHGIAHHEAEAEESERSVVISDTVASLWSRFDNLLG